MGLWNASLSLRNENHALLPCMPPSQARIYKLIVAAKQKLLA